MKRRELIAGLGGAALWGFSRPVKAQTADRMRRLAVLFGGSATPDIGLFNTFQQQLDELGWKTGRNIRIDLRWGEANADLMPRLAAELVANPPDLIFAYNNQALATIKPIAGNVPIVFAGIGDPVGSGFVASLARPGGNITGFESFVPTMGGKWLEILEFDTGRRPTHHE
jgi:putative tryptophan/tyrosine transport system substrate-binding protein